MSSTLPRDRLGRRGAIIILPATAPLSVSQHYLDRRMMSRLNEIAVSNRQTLGDVSQFCDKYVLTARNSLILKRRDVGVVDRARLEIEAGDGHQAIPTRVNRHATSDFTFQAHHAVCVRKSRCFSGCEPEVSQSYHNSFFKAFQRAGRLSRLSRSRNRGSSRIGSKAGSTESLTRYARSRYPFSSHWKASSA